MPRLSAQLHGKNRRIERIADLECAARRVVVDVSVVHPFANFMRQRADVSVNQLLVRFQIGRASRMLF